MTENINSVFERSSNIAKPRGKNHSNLRFSMSEPLLAVVVRQIAELLHISVGVDMSLLYGDISIGCSFIVSHHRPLTAVIDGFSN